ncbi:hypothetical protein AK973_3858 [Pseudomonas brassicacearum]|nr:hypothetical protein AK973_3858 [Pseudomonas brassicacearum]
MGRSSYADPCGSELARDGGGTFNMGVGWPTAIASKLAPTVVLGWSQDFSYPTGFCLCD